METKNRTVWIVVAIVLVLLCCCMAALAAAAIWAFTTLPADVGLRPASLEDLGVRPPSMTESVEQSFEVDTAPELQIDNFAGDITVRAGASGTIAVVATKRASPGADLGQVTIQMQEQEGGIAIKTEKPFSLSNASVDLEIVAPSDARLDLRLGAGKVEIEGLNNGIVVDNGWPRCETHRYCCRRNGCGNTDSADNRYRARACRRWAPSRGKSRFPCSSRQSLRS